MIEIERSGHALLPVRFVLTPNRSIPWPALLRFYLFFCAFSLSLAGGFLCLGYWMVLPFSGIEFVVLGVGLYLTSRKSYQQQVISIKNSQLILQKGFNKVSEEFCYDINWLTIKQEKSYGYRKIVHLYIGSHGDYQSMGEFLTETEKHSLVFELNKVILGPLKKLI